MKATVKINSILLSISIISFFMVLLVINFSSITQAIKIPKNFTIGAGTSAYQVEGAWNIGDKAESNLDIRYVDNKDNGTVACDFYHKYQQDIKIAKDIGLNYFRLSLSWSRILPNGTNTSISQDGLKFYHNVIDEILSNGIEPVVTIYHWDHPQIFDKNRWAWLDTQMIDLFADYAKVLFKNFGSKVKFWTTINQPNIYCQFWTFNVSLYDMYTCGKTMIKAHAKVYHLYNQEFRSIQGGKIGISSACLAYLPVNSESLDCSSSEYEKDCGWIYNPIYSQDGDWPKVIKELIIQNSERVNQFPVENLYFTPEEIKNIKGTSDYLGLNYYSGMMSEYSNGICYIFKNSEWTRKASSFHYSVPEGLRYLLNTIKNKYNNPSVYILENGFPSTEKGINDVERINYLYSHIKEAILARETDKCNVEKFMIWSFIDTFEWKRGYYYQWGLVQVNFDSVNLTRTLRLSGKWLTKVIRDQELVEYHDGMEL